MPKYFNLIIVTPEKPVLEEKVSFVSLPGYEGELGIMAGHIPYIAQLKEGILRYTSEKEKGEFAIMGGFAQISDDTVSVFAEGAELATEINAELERQKIQRLKDILALKDKSMDIETAQANLKKSILRMKLVNRTRRQSRPPKR